MATRSLIGKYTNNNTTWKYIYCHWDGYPENNGKLLIDNYTDIDTVNKLLDLGDIASLGKLPEKIEGNDETDITIAYHRDRHWDKNPAIEAPIDTGSLQASMQSDSCDYAYIFDISTKRWKCIKLDWTTKVLQEIDLYTL